jgi:hypothetical protein
MNLRMTAEPKLTSQDLAERTNSTPRRPPAAIRSGMLRVGGYPLGMMLTRAFIGAVGAQRLDHRCSHEVRGVGHQDSLARQVILAGHDRSTGA